MADFYTKVFGWKTEQLDGDMGNYVLAIISSRSYLSSSDGSALSIKHMVEFLLGKHANCLSLIVLITIFATSS
jgi:hypothetical protein